MPIVGKGKCESLFTNNTALSWWTPRSFQRMVHSRCFWLNSLLVSSHGVSKKKETRIELPIRKGSWWRFYFGNLEEVLRWNGVNLQALFMFQHCFLQLLLLLGWIATRGCSCRRRRARPSFLASHWRMLVGGKSLTTPNIVRRNKT